MKMVKNALKRFLALALCVLLVFAIFPVVANAADLTGFGVDGLTADSDSSWSAYSGTIEGNVQTGGCDSAASSTLTLTNKKGNNAILSFDYTPTISGSASVTIGGTAYTEAGRYSQPIAADGTLTIVLSCTAASASAKITITNISLIIDTTATATFVPSQNGSYTVDGTSITEEYTNTQSSLTAYQVVATPDAGYKFMGWYNETASKYLSINASTALNIESDCTISAKFVADNTAIFEVSGQPFADLSEAISYAQANSQSKITLISNGIISGNYTIPAGITLLIPFDAAGTLFLDTPTALVSGNVSTKSNEYKRLTLAEGATLTIQGGLSVGGQHRACAGSSAGYMSGNYGQVWLNSGSSIVVENGGSLYAWGFVSGDGAVTVRSGGTAYEWYQITDFRGGTASSAMGNSVFPFSQYYVQNIESAITLEQGASEIAYVAVYAISRINPSAIPFVGKNGMFNVVSGSLTKKYDGTTDRTIYTVNGEAEVNNLNLKLAGQSVSSKDYVLPLTNNMTVNLSEGSKLTINQTAALLPGVQANIAQGAELVIFSGNSVYVYDRDEWVANSYTCSGKFVAVKYSPSKTYNRTDADLVDAKVNIDGTLSVDGTIYTTASGADICSTGTGVFKQNAALGTETTTYQYTQSGSSVTAHEIAITPAKLHNADGSYTETATVVEGTTIPYVSGVWGGTAKATITFDPNGGTGTMSTMEFQPGTKISLTPNTFTREGYTFTGWNTAADGTGTAYADQATVNFDADTTLYAQWTQNPVITFDANGGEGIMGAQAVKPNEATALNANTFTRADYDFAGWNTVADGSGTAYADTAEITVGENTTLYAQWTLHKYHVRWLNWDGSVLQEGDYTCEDYAEWNMDNEDPSRPADENYTYIFLNRWTPYDEAAGIDGWGFNPHQDVDFTAVFNQFEKLTVTFDANGGAGTMDAVKIPNGKSGEYYTLPECGFTREGYTFDGWLITGTVGYNASEAEDLQDEKWDDTMLLAFSDLTLKASWKEEITSYTITWKNWDGTELATTTVNAGEVPAYTGETPTKAETQHHTYEFTGWDPSPAAVTEDTVYTAQFKEIGKTGLCIEGDGTYWLENGEHVLDKGLTQVKDVEGHNLYYYFGEDGKAVKNVLPEGGKDFWVSKEKANGLLPEWGYYFDENGIILHDDQFQNGIVDGYYYIDGIKVHMGMFKQGEDYYYAKSDGQLIVGRKYYCERNNDLLPVGYYTFDETGKMIDPPTQDTTKNGIVAEDGSLFYYENGFRTYAGLIKIGDAYYYVKTNGEVVHGKSYWISKTNGLMSERSYRFDDDGKMLDPEIKQDPTLNGIVKEDGTLYYYVNGLRTYAGLIEIDGSYYYVKTSGEVVHGRSYWITKTNGLMAEGSYTFDADGKMTNPRVKDTAKNGIVEEDGSLYYYVDGLRSYAGLIKLGDDYYYVRTSGEVVHGRSYWITKTNGLLPEKSTPLPTTAR